ncbi:NAD(P)-binding domain-containing protein [Nonomuraea antimicrobica]|uniref:NAD(P)-binding domain-containing protein n=1 Tax=Nonomuraea antimicrobica TaxID=561173 RepID=A0ABP7BI40_9ACTN
MSPDPAQRPVTVIGLGQMGTSIVTALLAAGHPATVWNRSPDKAEPLVAKGAVRAGSAAEAVAAGPTIILTLSDADTVREILEPVASGLAGRTLINLTTSAPEQSRALAAWVAKQGADYLDGAMMALPETVATPDAFFLYSGPKEVFDAERSMLEVLASAHHLGEDPGTAELYDLGLLGSGYAMLAGFLHALALVDTAGVRPAEFLPLVSRWLHGMIDYIPELAREIESGDYASPASPVGMNRAGVAALIRVSLDAGIDPAVHAALWNLLGQRTADGHGKDSFASVFELLRRRP